MDKRKIGEWMQDLDSHSIYDSESIKKELTALGYYGPWPHETTVGELRNRIGEFKGPIEVKGEYQEKTMKGWEIAEIVCKTITGKTPGDVYHGRGSKFRACVAELTK